MSAFSKHDSLSLASAVEFCFYKFVYKTHMHDQISVGVNVKDVK